jgi:hypothetical protein
MIAIRAIREVMIVETEEETFVVQPADRTEAIGMNHERASHDRIAHPDEAAAEVPRGEVLDNAHADAAGEAGLFESGQIREGNTLPVFTIVRALTNRIGFPTR